jgi:hypothetical protein
MVCKTTAQNSSSSNSSNNSSSSRNNSSSSNNNKFAFTCYPTGNVTKVTRMSKIADRKGKGKNLTFTYIGGSSPPDDNTS